MRRNVMIGCAFLAVFAALGVGQTVAGRAAAAQAKDMVEAPRFEVDPMWPKPLPHHWVLGSTIGVSVDAQDHVWIIHRGAATLAPKEQYASWNPARRRVLHGRAARPRVRSGRQPPARVGRSGPRLRMARVQPRHHRRQQGHRLDRRQRARRRADPEVHARRKVRGGVRLPVSERRQQRPLGVPPGRQDLRRREEQRGVRRRRLRQQARRRHRRRQRQDQAVLGRVRPQARRHAARSVQSVRAARAAVPKPGALRRAVERRATSTSATGRTIASRSSGRTGRS